MKITLDDGAVFDILAIIEVKCKARKINVAEDNNYLRLCNEISEQIGEVKFSRIRRSKEYQDLINANGQVFGLVELAQQDDGLAKIVDLANYERFRLKTKLQKKFFKTKPMEIKIGY